jgi:ATPase subunit of ABC transporter with duplicated ATPase domains
MAPALELIEVGYTFPDGSPLFQHVSASFGPELTGLVGPNGVGKSTLLRIVAGHIQPSSGAVLGAQDAGYLAQEPVFATDADVGGLLGVRDIRAAMARLDAGGAAADDAAAVADYWSARAHMEVELGRLGLSHLEFDAPVARLSGGERSRLALLAVMLRNPGQLLLDEPTNHLDAANRRILRDTLRRWRHGALVVSHDRELLDDMDRIVELSPTGLTPYGGGYALYAEQKRVNEAAAEKTLHDATRALVAHRRQAQESKEREQRRSGSGKQRAARRNASALEIGAAKEQSGKTARRTAVEQRARSAEYAAQLRDAQQAVSRHERLSFQVPTTQREATHPLLHAEELCFGFVASRILFRNLSFTLMSGERLAIAGPNGSGKSTLLKILAGRLDGYQGRLVSRAKHALFLDQHFNEVLHGNSTVLAAFERHNPCVSTTEARTHMARFLFRGPAALKLVANLSGGERLRAALACVLAPDRATDLILLDEPTNNLDLDGIRHLEEVLQAYRGAIVAISHDEHFLDAIGTRRHLTLGPGE